MLKNAKMAAEILLYAFSLTGKHGGLKSSTQLMKGCTNVYPIYPSL